MSGVDDLVTWLRAQLDEDEKRARICDAHDWRYVGYGTIVDRDVDGWQSVPDAARIFSFVDPDRSDEAVHAITHDPLRVMAEVEAKRRILDIHGTGSDPCDAHDASLHTIPCDTLLLLALPYADRPGYRDEWRP